MENNPYGQPQSPQPQPQQPSQPTQPVGPQVQAQQPQYQNYGTQLPQQPYQQSYGQPYQAPPVAPPSSNKGRAIVIGLAMVFFVVAAFAGGAMYWSATHPVKETAPAAEKTDEEKAALSKTETVTGKVFVAEPKHPVTEAITPSKLSLTAPKAWRVTDSIRTASRERYGADFVPSDIIAQLDSISTNADWNPNVTVLSPGNRLTILRVEDWLTTTSTVLGQPLAAQQKQVYYDYYANLKSTTLSKDAECIKMPAAFFTHCDDKPASPTLITTEDKKLRGVAYFSGISEANKYNPTVKVILAGTANGSKVMAYGTYSIYDKAFGELSAKVKTGEEDARLKKVTAANEAIVTSKLSDDTKELYQELQTVIKSLKISKIEN